MNSGAPKYKNIMIRGFDAPQSYSAVEVLLAELRPEHCWFFIDPDHYPNRPELKVPPGIQLHEINVKPIALSDFRAIITEIKPLDRQTIEKMALHETLTLRMAERMGAYPDIDHYRRRKWHYLDQLAAWKTFLEFNKIDLYLIHDVPHHPMDYVPYALLREANVPSYYFEKLPVPDSGFVASHWEDAGKFIREHYDKLKSSGSATDLKLGKVYDDHFKMQIGEAGKPKYAHIETIINDLKSGVSITFKLQTKLRRLFLHLRSLFSKEIVNYFNLDYWYKRKHSHERETKRLHSYYMSLTKEPNWSSKFVYFPLQYQPEGSTSPMCGAFNELQLMAKILSASVPEDWKIYVKEYRGQTIMGRRTEFYDTLLKLGNIQLLDPQISSMELIKKSQAVATGTGTAAWESLFQEKPVLLFGHPSFQFAPGLNTVRSQEDCKKAINAAIAGIKPSINDLKLYLKAAEELLIPCYNEAVFEGDSTLSHDQNGKNLAKSLLRALQRE